ncbi:(Ribosomal protein S18)-alanine N-acetyltransferase [Gammaproteobacteria bacterium]
MSYDFPWSKQLFEDCLRVGYCCWVCGDSDILCGYGILSVGAGECHVLNVCVVPKLRSQGLGRYLMRHLLHLGKRHRSDTAFLEVRVSNQTAIHLYQTLGFNEIGTRRAYYPARSGREDAIMFAKHL